jgi:hypothetical protein
MHIAIWMIGLLLLTLWSATVWLGYSLSHLALTLPWQQAATSAAQLQIPEILKPFLDPIVLIFSGESWANWVQGLAPLMQWLGNLLQGSAGWLTAALPLVAWLIWGLGALLIVALAAAGSAGLWFWRRRTTSSGSGMSGSSAKMINIDSINSIAKHPVLNRLRRKFLG